MFRINNIEWYIVLVEPDHFSLFRSDGSLSLAACDNNLKVIFINKTIRGYELKKVISHELTHAFMFSYHVSLSIDEEELLADLVATYGEDIINLSNKIFNKIKRGRFF